jgi:hypothetical protein
MTEACLRRHVTVNRVDMVMSCVDSTASRVKVETRRSLNKTVAAVVPLFVGSFVVHFENAVGQFFLP